MKRDTPHRLFLPSGCLRPETLGAMQENRLDGKDREAVMDHCRTCEFCADAMEGLMKVNAQDLSGQLEKLSQEAIRKYAHGSSSPKKVKRLTPYLPLAAALLLLIGAAGIMRLIRDLPDGQTVIPEAEVQVPAIDQTASEMLSMNTDNPKRLLPPVPVSLPVSSEKKTKPSTKPGKSDASPVPVLPGSQSDAAGEREETSPVAEEPAGTSPEVENSGEERLSPAESPSENTSAPVDRDGHFSGPSAGDPSFYYTVEDMPRFQRGDLSRFRDYIQSRLRYPALALREGIEGTVYISFIIDAEGHLQKAGILQGVHPLLDQEALRVVSASPSWTPGMQKGKKVNVGFIIPVKFRIE
jgi:TonB family protein